MYEKSALIRTAGEVLMTFLKINKTRTPEVRLITLSGFKDDRVFFSETCSTWTLQETILGHSSIFYFVNEVSL